MLVTDQILNNKSILNILDFQDDVDKLKALLGILNSRFISLYYKERAVKAARKIFPKVVSRNLAEFPFPLSIKPAQQRKFCRLVDIAIAYHAKLAELKPNINATMLVKRIEIVERQIDLEVYRIFGLSSKEIGMIEEIGT
jgi:adenine-specific DNA-methyltransferase